MIARQRDGSGSAKEEMRPDAPEFTALLDQLRTDVLEHAHNEETDEFRYLRKDATASQLRALVAVVEAAEAVAPTHPHPGVESAGGGGEPSMPRVAGAG